MVIETFASVDAARAVYARFRERGRMAPEGLTYVQSWTEEALCRCYQVMEADPTQADALFAAWTANWDDLVAFTIVPVITGAEAAARLLGGEPTA